MKKIVLSKADLNKIKQNEMFESYESDVYIINENEQKKVIKIFNKNIDLNNKLKKICLIKERLNNFNNVVTASEIVYYEDQFIGYTMPYIEGKYINSYYLKRKKEIIKILKKVSNTLKELHKKNIICGDFENNILIDKLDNIFFIDHDNFSIDNIPIDTKNVYLKKYMKHVRIFDERFDNYLLNLLTICLLNNSYILYTFDMHYTTIDHLLFKDKEINNIIKNTIKLNSEYNEELIIDKLNTKKDLKKIKRKIF